jgi:hypothetical protein
VNNGLHKTFVEVRLRHLCEVTLDAKYAPSVEGFIVDWSDSLVLMHLFDRENFCLNGYCAVGLRFLKAFDHAGADRNWMESALRKMRLKPVFPKRMNITDWGALITAIDEAVPACFLSASFCARAGGWLIFSISGLTAICAGLGRSNMLTFRESAGRTVTPKHFRASHRASA